MSPRRCVLFTLIAASACLIGCSGSSLNQTNFERLKVGMTPQQVEGILGKGGKDVSNEEVTSMMKEAIGFKDGKLPGMKFDAPDFSGAKGVRWGDDKKSITVIYVNDRASRIYKKGF